MLARPAKHLKEFFETCVTTGDSNFFKEMDLQGDRELEIAAFSSVKSRVIEKVLHFFSSRFSSSTHAVLKAGIIFDHKTWPVDVKELATFGEEAVRTLLQHFQTPLINKGCNLTDVEQEWAPMKVYIFEHLRLLHYEILWQRMLNEHSDEYKNVLMLVEIILILPMSTACCERGFSAMKWAKNYWRSSLSNRTLNDVLKIMIDGPSVEAFNAGKPLQMWWNCSRRPNFQRITSS